MSKMGLGGKTLDLIKSMYRNDNLRFVVNGKLTEKLWLTDGVKQGCSLSPLLFAIFISDLGKQLNKTKCGIEIQDCIISCIFFADDIVLIGRSASHMNELIRILTSWNKQWGMSISIKK